MESFNMSQLNLDIRTKLDELESALLNAHPGMPTLLRDIHKTLKAQPDIVTLLSESDLAIIVRGLDKQTNAHLVATTLKPTKATKASLKNVTSDDLGF